MEDKIERILSLSETTNRRLEESNSVSAKILHIFEKLLVPIMLGVLAFVANDASNKIAESQLALSSQESDRRRAEFQAQIQTKYIELFYTEISSGDGSRQTNALQLLRLMDNDLAASFATLVGQQEGVSADIKTEALNIKSNVEYFSVLSGFKIGIYYLPANQELPSLAANISNSLKNKGFNGNIQIYKKNFSFFKKVAMPKANEIRYEPGIEGQQADLLVEFLSELYPNKKFTKRAVHNRTSSFISIFLK